MAYLGATELRQACEPLHYDPHYCSPSPGDAALFALGGVPLLLGFWLRGPRFHHLLLLMRLGLPVWLLVFLFRLEILVSGALVVAILSTGIVAWTCAASSARSPIVRMSAAALAASLVFLFLRLLSFDHGISPGLLVLPFAMQGFAILLWSLASPVLANWSLQTAGHPDDPTGPRSSSG